MSQRADFVRRCLLVSEGSCTAACVVILCESMHFVLSYASKLVLFAMVLQLLVKIIVLLSLIRIFDLVEL